MQGSNRKPFVTLSRVTLTPGARTHYVGRAGQTYNEVTLSRPFRDTFFQERPRLKNLLLRQVWNPLVEEGRYTDRKDSVEERDNRDREGELYLGPEALRMWIQKKFYDDPHAAEKYNQKNIFVVENNWQQFYRILYSINLQEGEDAKFIMILTAHAITLYLRRENGQIKCFIANSQAGYKGYWNEHIVQALQKFFDNPLIIQSGTLMQKDMYSCYTYAMNALIYFAAHGKEIFPYLEQQQLMLHEATGSLILPQDRLMPALLKLTQNLFPIPVELLNTIVSRKKNLTLGQYLQNNLLKLGEKNRNIAALAKKYKFFAQVDEFIQSHTNAPISTNPDEPLPEELQLKSLSPMSR